MPRTRKKRKRRRRKKRGGVGTPHTSTTASPRTSLQRQGAFRRRGELNLDALAAGIEQQDEQRAAAAANAARTKKRRGVNLGRGNAAQRRVRAPAAYVLSSEEQAKLAKLPSAEEQREWEAGGASGNIPQMWKQCGIGNKQTLYCLLQKHGGFKVILQQIEFSENIHWGLASILNEHLFGKDKLYDTIQPLMGYLIPKKIKKMGGHVQKRQKVAAWAIQKIANKYKLKLETTIGPIYEQLSQIQQKWTGGGKVKLNDLLTLLSNLLFLTFTLKHILEYVKTHKGGWRHPINNVIHRVIMPPYKQIVIQVHCLLSPFGISIPFLDSPDVVCPSPLKMALQDAESNLKSALELTEHNRGQYQASRADDLFYKIRMAAEAAALDKPTWQHCLAIVNLIIPALKKTMELINTKKPHQRAWLRQVANLLGWAMNSAIQGITIADNFGKITGNISSTPGATAKVIKAQRRFRQRRTRKKWDKTIKGAKEKKFWDDVRKGEIERDAREGIERGMREGHLPGGEPGGSPTSNLGPQPNMN